jgi:hypothetical protein
MKRKTSTAGWCKLALVAVAALALSGCSLRTKVQIVQVAVFDQPFTVYQGGSVSSVLDANVAVVVMIKQFTQATMTTVFGQASQEGIETVKSLIGVDLTMDDLRRLIARNSHE